jgi:hypothetical protein
MRLSTMFFRLGRPFRLVGLALFADVSHLG